MSRALQPYASFPIENDRVNFHSDKNFSVHSMQTGNDQESVMLSEM